MKNNRQSYYIVTINDQVNEVYRELMGNWEIECRAHSSTGENMVKESMDADQYAEVKQRLFTVARQAVLKQIAAHVDASPSNGELPF
jgi:hypothetical protein